MRFYATGVFNSVMGLVFFLVVGRQLRCRSVCWGGLRRMHLRLRIVGPIRPTDTSVVVLADALRLSALHDLPW